MLKAWNAPWQHSVCVGRTAERPAGRGQGAGSLHDQPHADTACKALGVRPAVGPNKEGGRAGILAACLGLALLQGHSYLG